MADMSTAPKRSLSAARSIDAILDTLPAKPVATTTANARPSSSTQPFWIGPSSSVTKKTSGSTMEHQVMIEYSSKGLKPPVFICTNLSDPEWEPLEMYVDPMDEHEFHFYRSFSAPEGDYQYKLRLGPGDWWVCDESKPVVDDGAGNQNNVVTVKPDQRPPDYKDMDPNSRTYRRYIDGFSGTPLFDYEITSEQRRAMDEAAGDFDALSSPESDEPAPLMPHEMLAPSKHSLTPDQHGSSPRQSFSSVRRDSRRSMTIEDSDLDDPKLQPCLENKANILELARRMSLGLAPCLEAPDPNVKTKLLNRAFDVLQLDVSGESSEQSRHGRESLTIVEEEEEESEEEGNSRSKGVADDEEMAPDEVAPNVEAAMIDRGSGLMTPVTTPHDPNVTTDNTGIDSLTTSLRDSEIGNPSDETDISTDDRAKLADPRENNIPAVLLGLGFAVVVAATAICIWVMRPKN